MSTRIVKSLFALLLLSAVASAAPFNSIVVYGDSLSDNGNLHAATGMPPSPPYAQRFADGPVAVERLAERWNATLIDYAWGGATTGIGNGLDGGSVTGSNGLPGMRAVFDATVASLNPAGALFIVWGGPNDFVAPAPGDPFPEGVIARAVENLAYMVGGLQALGAEQILVPGIGDLGLTPFFRSQGPLVAAQASAVSDAFNASLQARLAPFGEGITYFDTASLVRAIAANPSAYGFTNIENACLSGGVVCGTPGSHLFWDDLHITAAAHEQVADAFADAVVPEPATVLMVTAGCLLLLPRIIRRKKYTV